MKLPAVVGDPLVQQNFDALMKYLRWGAGDPEGVIAAPLGAFYGDTANGALYVKEADGNQATGWAGPK